MRRSGMPASTRDRAASSSPSSSRLRSVRKRPGSRPSTRTPCGPYSSARSLATPARPGRRPLEMPRPVIGDRTEVDSTRPIAPPSVSAAATVRAVRTVPRKTVSKDSRHCASLTCAAVPGGGPPTETSAPSSRPKCPCAAATSRSGASGSARSATRPIAWSGPPSRSTASATRSGVRADRTTRAPSSTRHRAVAKPSPRDAPVTTYTRPVSSRSIPAILPYPGRWGQWRAGRSRRTRPASWRATAPPTRANAGIRRCRGGCRPS